MLPFVAQMAAGAVIDKVFEPGNKDQKGPDSFSKYKQLDKSIGEQKPLNIEIEKITKPSDEAVNDIGRAVVSDSKDKSLYDSISSDNKKMLEALYKNDEKINKNIESLSEGMERLNKNVEKVSQTSELYGKMGMEGLPRVGGSEGSGEPNIFIKLAAGLATLGLIKELLKKLFGFTDDDIGKGKVKTIQQQWKEFIKSEPFKVDIINFDYSKLNLGGEFNKQAKELKEEGEKKLSDLSKTIGVQEGLEVNALEDRAKYLENKENYKKEVDKTAKSKIEEINKNYKAGLAKLQAKQIDPNTPLIEKIRGDNGVNWSARDAAINEVKGDAEKEKKLAEDSFKVYEIVSKGVSKLQDGRFSLAEHLATLALVTQDKSYILKLYEALISEPIKTTLWGEATQKLEPIYGNSRMVDAEAKTLLDIYSDLAQNSNEADKLIHEIYHNTQKFVESIDFYEFVPALLVTIGYKESKATGDKNRARTILLYQMAEDQIKSLKQLALVSYSNMQKFEDLKKIDQQYDLAEAMGDFAVYVGTNFDKLYEDSTLSKEDKGKLYRTRVRAVFEKDSERKAFYKAHGIDENATAEDLYDAIEKNYTKVLDVIKKSEDFNSFTPGEGYSFKERVLAGFKGRYGAMLYGREKLAPYITQEQKTAEEQMNADRENREQAPIGESSGLSAVLGLGEEDSKGVLASLFGVPDGSTVTEVISKKLDEFGDNFMDALMKGSAAGNKSVQNNLARSKTYKGLENQLEEINGKLDALNPQQGLNTAASSLDLSNSNGNNRPDSFEGIRE